LVSFVLVAAFGLLGGFVKVPYVALGPGPTYDTLGSVGSTPVVDVAGTTTYPTTGQLRMTTVSVTDDITLFGALGLWASGRFGLAPREEFFPPSKPQQQVQQENVKQFQDSQTSAEVAALRYLGYPMKVLVGDVVSGSPADGTIQPGDRLLVVNGQQVTSADQVRGALANTKPGQQVAVQFQHAGAPERTATFTLANRSDRPQGFLGIGAIERPDVPFQVKISLSENVGGPSAGLMFALAIVDKLTPNGLDAGASVAGTGDIDDKGAVRPIGGIPFKMAAAKDAGATIFLVPSDNCAEAKQRAPQGLRLVKVGSVDEAAHALQALHAGKDVPSC
jgi:PDZ domain-containing protein